MIKIKVLFLLLVSCAQFPFGEKKVVINKEAEVVTVEDTERNEYQPESTVKVVEEDFEETKIDLIFLGAGIKSIGISKVINEMENEKIEIGKVSGKSFGLLISEVYKLKKSSNYMDWIFFKYFKKIKNINFVNNILMNKRISKLADSELNKETANLVKKQNGLLTMARDFSIRDCEQSWYETSNKIWCLLSGERNKIYELKDLNMTVFELKAGLLNKDSLVDILELGKIFFRTHTKEN